MTAPKGCLVNPNYPAPVRARMLSAYRCFNAVLKALAQVVPDRVIAGGNDSTDVTAISASDRATSTASILRSTAAAMAPGPRLDGCDAVDSPLSNCTNTPVEACDMDFDYFRIVAYELIPDSGGHGRRRGGLGLKRSFEILKDDTNFACYSDRMRLAPYGLLGGGDGQRCRIEIQRGDTLIKVKSKDRIDLKKGDVLTLSTAGGGGYGPVSKRESAMVERDVRNGVVSLGAARRDYGYKGE